MTIDPNDYTPDALALEDKVEQISHDLLGTCQSWESVTDVSPDGQIAELVYGVVDLCACCGWWHYTHQLDAQDGADLKCDECWEDEDNDED